MQFDKQLHIPQIIPALTPPPDPIHRLPQTRRRIRKPKHHIFGRRPRAVVKIQTLRVRGVLDWTVWLGAGKLRTQSAGLVAGGFGGRLGGRQIRGVLTRAARFVALRL